MKPSANSARRYLSVRREENAQGTRQAILSEARKLFSEQGIDRVTILQISRMAGVSASTVYALFKSKEGILRAIAEASLFGEPYRQAQMLLQGETDPVRMVALTPRLSCVIYESEARQMGLLRGASSFSPALKQLEKELEDLRYTRQEERLRLLFAAGKAKSGLSLEDARRIRWMYTSRDIYRMLVEESGWSSDRYQTWLTQVLLGALVEEPDVPAGA